MKQAKKIKTIKAEMKKIWKKIDAKREKKIVFPKKLTKKQEEMYGKLVRSQRMDRCGSEICACPVCQEHVQSLRFSRHRRTSRTMMSTSGSSSMTTRSPPPMN